MKIYGKIEVILNDQLLLLSSKEPLVRDQIVDVFAQFEDPKLREKGHQEPIIYPKGELRILNKQEGDIYLAERFREIHHRTKKIKIPAPWAGNLGKFLKQLEGETKEIEEEVPGEWSAEFNTEQSLNLSLSKAISVGDLIGRLS